MNAQPVIRMARSMPATSTQPEIMMRLSFGCILVLVVSHDDVVRAVNGIEVVELVTDQAQLVLSAIVTTHEVGVEDSEEVLEVLRVNVIPGTEVHVEHVTVDFVQVLSGEQTAVIAVADVLDGLDKAGVVEVVHESPIVEGVGLVE